MPKVTELLASRITNAQINVETWGGVIINVKAYGAKGDGVTDDTEAIQKALNRYNVPTDGETSVIVFFPVGVYVLGNPLVPPPFTIVMGSGVKGTTLKPSGDFPAIKFQQTMDRNAHILLRDFFVDASNCTTSAALHLWRPIIGTGVYNVRVEGKGSGKTGVYVEEGDIRLSSVQAQSFTGVGFEFTSGIGQILIEDCYAEDNDKGLYIHDTQGSASAVNVLSFHTELCRTYAIHTKNTSNITIRDISGGMVSTGQYYVYLDTGTSLFRLENVQCLFGSRPVNMLKIVDGNVDVPNWDTYIFLREINDYYYQSEAKQYIYNPQYLQTGTFSGSIPGYGQENAIVFPVAFDDVPKIRLDFTGMSPDAQVTIFPKSITKTGFSIYTNASGGTSVSIDWKASGILGTL